jgi:hypothetical protein
VKTKLVLEQLCGALQDALGAGGRVYGEVRTHGVLVGRQGPKGMEEEVEKCSDTLHQSLSDQVSRSRKEKTPKTMLFFL